MSELGRFKVGDDEIMVSAWSQGISLTVYSRLPNSGANLSPQLAIELGELLVKAGKNHVAIMQAIKDTHQRQVDTISELMK